jgi:hypothetical protein
MSTDTSGLAQGGANVNVALSPVFRPVAAPGIGVADQATMLPMAADDDRGVVVAGCRTRLDVFQLFSRQRLWYTITAHASLSGYTLGAGVLYVQDGPVLSCWDLTTATLSPGQQTATGFRLAAINLVTKAAASGGATGVSDAAYAALFTAASTPGCSAPVVRTQQLGAAAGAMVFVLGTSGSVFAVDDALTQVTAISGAPPGPLALGLSEKVAANDPSQVTCTLAYVAQDTSLVLLDLSGALPEPAGTWPKDPSPGGPPKVDGSPPPVVLGPQTPAVAPQFIDDTVVACCAFGVSFAVCPLPPPTPSVFRWAVGATGSPAKYAQGLEVSTTRQLVLLQGLASPLVSYAPEAMVVERWPDAGDESHRWVTFWEPATDLTTQPGLILAVDQVAAPDTLPLRVPLPPDVAFAVRVANTVDYSAADNAELSQGLSGYPPPPATLIGGTLSLAPFAAGRVSAVLCQPLIVREWLFALIADETGAVWLGAWALATIAAKALPAAAAELQRLALLVTPVPLKVFVFATADSLGEPTSIVQADDPSTGPFTIDGYDGRLEPDDSGNCPLPGTFWGQTITGHFAGHTGSVVATPGTQPVLRINLYVQSPAPGPADAAKTSLPPSHPE